MTFYTIDASAFHQNIGFVNAYDIFSKNDDECRDLKYLTAVARKALATQVFILILSLFLGSIWITQLQAGGIVCLFIIFQEMHAAPDEDEAEEEAEEHVSFWIRFIILIILI